jgi:hypothetical protein
MLVLNHLGAFDWKTTTAAAAFSKVDIRDIRTKKFML